MLLSELFGDDSHNITSEELEFFMNAKQLWSPKFDKIVRETQEPQIKTRIHIKKKRKHG